MRTLKYLISFAFVLVFINCTNDENNFDYLDSAVAPSEVTANFFPILDEVTGDKGLIKITPNAVGAVSYSIDFGDGTEERVNLRQGESVQHKFDELPENEFYSVVIEAVGITGLKTEVTKELPVIFEPPVLNCDIEDAANNDIVIENNPNISKQVDVTVTAKYGVTYSVYFGEPGIDEPKTANNGETLSYPYQEAGTYSIRIVTMSASSETTECTFDFEVTAILQPLTKAPVPPVRDTNDVISIYSDAYANVSLSEVNPNWGQSTVLTEVQIDGNNTWYYTNLNYTGIVTDYGNPTDLSEMTFVHFDYWTPNGTALGLKLVNTSYGDGDPLKEDTENVGTVTQNEWVSIDIPLANFTTDMSGITQLLFDSLGATADVFIDNLYFYKPSTVADTPAVNAPSPTQNQTNVISIFSDDYTNVGISELNPNWGQTTDLTPVDIAGNKIWLYENLNYTGIVTDYSNPTNLASMDFVHFDYFTPDATALGLKLVNTTYGDGDPLKEDIEFVGDIVRGTWVSVTIPLDDYSTDRSAVTQLVFDSGGNSAKVYIDNLYFYTEIGAQPTVIAPEPTIDASNVASIFSDSYTSVGISELNPNWGQTTTLTPVVISGNNIWLYENLNYTGIVTNYDNPTNLSGFKFVHFDYFTPDATALGLKLVNTSYGDGDPLKEDIEFVGDIVTGTWISVTISLADYNNDLSAITQLVFDSGGNSATVYIDNLYFHN